MRLSDSGTATANGMNPCIDWRNMHTSPGHHPWRVSIVCPWNLAWLRAANVSCRHDVLEYLRPSYTAEWACVPICDCWSHCLKWCTACVRQLLAELNATCSGHFLSVCCCLKSVSFINDFIIMWTYTDVSQTQQNLAGFARVLSSPAFVCCLLMVIEFHYCSRSTVWWRSMLSVCQWPILPMDSSLQQATVTVGAVHNVHCQTDGIWLFLVQDNYWHFFQLKCS